MKFTFLLLASVILLLFHAGLQAAEIPEEIKKLVPLYPEAAIGSCETSKQITRVRFGTSSTPKEVFEFYKKEMIGRGWAMVYQNETENETRLVMKKGDLQFGFGSYQMPKKSTGFFFSVKQKAKKMDTEKAEEKKTEKD